MEEASVPEYEISLPEDVSEADWEIERDEVQNHRIRVVAASLRAIDDILESDYAFLHCSPERLQETWSTLVEVVANLRSDIRGALETPSRVPKLETARGRASDSLAILDLDLLARIDKYPADLPEDLQPEVRRLLCSVVGQLHAFLGHTLSALLDADPRGMGANDYSLSRRFPRHVHEAEWLYYSVGRLHDYLVDLDTYRDRQIKDLESSSAERRTVPVGAEWGNLMAFLEEVLETLVPQLKDVRAMEGIRYDEMQVLDEYLMSVPAACHTVIELQSVGRALIDRESRQEEVDLMSRVQALLSKRLNQQVSRIDGALEDLSAFVGIWRAGIGHRRALQFRETR
jgi:hypothetical protein